MGHPGTSKKKELLHRRQESAWQATESDDHGGGLLDKTCGCREGTLEAQTASWLGGHWGLLTLASILSHLYLSPMPLIGLI